jgi:hypothetical protein
MKIIPVEEELFHTDRKKVTVSFHDFTNASNNAMLYVYFIYIKCTYLCIL